MVVYSIKDIEKLTGVKAHTLRIWEKRYSILNPKRTKTNIRYYLEEDLRDIMNISFLNRNGYKISKIAILSSDERKRIAAKLSKLDIQFENQIDAITMAILDLDQNNLNHILDHHIKQIGFERTIKEIINPMLEKLWVMWIAGSITGVHERFVSQLLLRKSIVAINEIKGKKDKPKGKAIVYLPEKENHELSLYFLHFLLIKNGYEVLNLGKDINLTNILNAQRLYQSEYIFTIINDSFEDKPLFKYIETILSSIDCKFVISGYQPVRQEIKTTEKCIILNSIMDVESFLEKFKNDPIKR